mgnify:CR=1 FL=1
MVTSVRAAQSEYTVNADDVFNPIAAANGANIFLGLGLPWTIATIYQWAEKDSNFYIGRMETGDINFACVSLLIATACFVIILVMRRFFAQGEIGGTNEGRFCTSFVMFMLWIIFVVLNCLNCYGEFGD